MWKTSAALRGRGIYWQGASQTQSITLPVCPVIFHRERWLAKVNWVYAKEQSCWKGDGHLNVCLEKRSIVRIFSIKKCSTQWCVNHGILHSLLLGWQILYKQKQENVPYQKAFLDKSLVLSPPPPALYTRLSVSDRLEVLMEIKIKRGRGCVVKFAFGRWIKVTFPFKSN